MEQIELHAQEDGVRLDVFLAACDRIGGRSAAQRLIEAGAVREICGGKPLKKNHRVEAGQTFLVTLPDPEPLALMPEDIPLDIVYEDEDVIVINKPKGLVVHPAPGHPDGTLVNALLYHCGDSLSGIGGERRPGIVHRIDKDTSGLLIAAKNDMAHRSLSQQLKDRSLSRVYEALVCGLLKQQEGTVALSVGRHPVDRQRMAANVRGGREAVTHWQVIRRYQDVTHVRCMLETGRTHQIRVHMAAISRPILGDSVYGGKTALRYGQTTQCLHARRLKFIHPRTGRPMELECPLPDYFLQLLDRLEKIC